MALVATHLVSQPAKPDHPYRVTLDMKDLYEKLCDKGPCLIPNIELVIAKRRAHTYFYASDIKKHYWQVMHQ